MVNTEAPSPPITARPSGADCSPPSPMPIARGSMPAIIARLVIRIGRSRSAAACRAAPSAGRPPRRSRSANDTRRIALAVDTPRAMIAPMKDWRLSVVPVIRSATATPTITTGAPDTAISASRGDWKAAVSTRRMTATAVTNPIDSPRTISSSGANWPRRSTFTPLGGGPVAATAAATARDALPRSVPATLAMIEIVRRML